MLNRLILRPLRDERGWSQEELGASVGITQTRISEIERGRRELSARLAHDLERELALGDPMNDEDEPSWVLCELTPGGHSLELLITEDGRVGVYRDRNAAEAAAQILRRVAKLRVFATPTWLRYPAQILVSRRGLNNVDASDLYVVDEAKAPTARAEAAIRHVLALLESFGTDGSREEAIDRIAELAASARAKASTSKRKRKIE